MDVWYFAHWTILLFLAISFSYVETHHMLHYLHLKKFITAVAFARALGKRPTVLPVPIPIPIPIAQNEIIKLPLPAGGKTMVIGNGGSKQSVDVSKLLSGLSQTNGNILSQSTYGYSKPTISGGNIDLQSLVGSDSNVINLAAALRNSGNNGPTKIIILGNQNSGKMPDSSLDASSFLGLGNSNFQFDKGIHFGNNLGDLDSAFSFSQPGIFNIPSNLYTDQPRRKIPFAFGRRRWKSPDQINYSTNPRFSQNRERIKTVSQNSISFNQMQNRNVKTVSNKFPENMKKEGHKRPISVGEKFDEPEIGRF